MSNDIETTSSAISSNEVEVALSASRKAIIRDVGASGFRQVERLSGVDSQMLDGNLALYSIVSIDGEKLVPVRTESHLESRANRLSTKEFIKLRSAYRDAFDPFDTADPKD